MLVAVSCFGLGGAVKLCASNEYCYAPNTSHTACVHQGLLGTACMGVHAWVLCARIRTHMYAWEGGVAWRGVAWRAVAWSVVACRGMACRAVARRAVLWSGVL